MSKSKQVAAAFIAFWVAQSTHRYFVTEFSKFARFDPVGSTAYALVFTAAGLLLGLVLRWRPAAEAWRWLGRWTFVVSIVGLSLVVHDYIMWRHWAEGIQVSALGWPNLGCFLVGFPLLHLSSKEEPNQSSQPMPLARHG